MCCQSHVERSTCLFIYLPSCIICYYNSNMGKDKKCSIISEIERTEASIKTCFYRVEVLEKNLIARYISQEERERLEKELRDVKVLLAQNEAELKTLHKENSKTFAVAVIIMFFAFLFYGLYMMIVGREHVSN